MDKPRDLDTFHLFQKPERKQEWEARAEALRTRIQLACGLLPGRRKCELNPIVTATFESDGVRVENVAIQTLDGFWLCGNIYRPLTGGPFSAVANPHGHWTAGRRTREADVPRNAPGERLAAGKADLVQLAVSLARQGFLVFAYDMVGYNDTLQAGHGMAGTTTDWMWGVNLLGLQTWNSIRVLDYLESRPDVNRKRIGVTGASGGGSQAFILAALDNRIQCSVPVNMVSTTMQGGCLCENAPGLRVDTDNVEIAALFAPKPQFLVSCLGDWSKTTPTVEGPAIRNVYQLYGASKAIAWDQFPYGHNYNRESREAMTKWMCRWLQGREDADVTEKPTSLNPERLRVFPSKRSVGLLNEKAVVNALRTQAVSDRKQFIARGVRGSAKWIKEATSWLQTSLAVVPPTVRKATSGGDAIIAVGAQAIQAARTAASNATSVIPVDVSSIGDGIDPWNGYHSTYNRPVIGEKVAAIIHAWAKAQSSHQRVRFIGIGADAPLVVFAAALIGNQLTGDVQADFLLEDTSSDAYWDGERFAPGLRAIGDVHVAAMLLRDSGVTLYGIRDARNWIGCERVISQSTLQSAS
jgi:dienelactone hydrolase